MIGSVLRNIWLFIILLPLLDKKQRLIVHSQRINRPPYFIPGLGDMSRFSLSENTPIDSPVYQLKGNFEKKKIIKKKVKIN